MYRPIHFSIASNVARSPTDDEHSILPAGLQQISILTQEKPRALIALMLESLKSNSDPSMKKMLVFCSSIDTAHRLTRLLQYFFLAFDYSCKARGENVDPVCVQEFSSLLLQKDRDNMLAAFRNGDINVLICSDAAARGIDLPTVDAVVNFDVPNNVKTYVHRVGRTARWGKTGEAFTILLENEIYKLKRVIDKLRNAGEAGDGKMKSKVLQRKVNEAGYFGLYDMDKAEYLADKDNKELVTSCEYLVNMSRRESVEWRKIVYSV